MVGLHWGSAGGEAESNAIFALCTRKTDDLVYVAPRVSAPPSHRRTRNVDVLFIEEVGVLKKQSCLPIHQLLCDTFALQQSTRQQLPNIRSLTTTYSRLQDIHFVAPKKSEDQRSLTLPTIRRGCHTNGEKCAIVARESVQELNLSGYWFSGDTSPPNQSLPMCQQLQQQPMNQSRRQGSTLSNEASSGDPIPASANDYTELNTPENIHQRSPMYPTGDESETEELLAILNSLLALPSPTDHSASVPLAASAQPVQLIDGSHHSVNPVQPVQFLDGSHHPVNPVQPVQFLDGSHHPVNPVQPVQFLDGSHHLNPAQPVQLIDGSHHSAISAPYLPYAHASPNAGITQHQMTSTDAISSAAISAPYLPYAHASPNAGITYYQVPYGNATSSAQVSSAYQSLDVSRQQEPIEVPVIAQRAIVSPLEPVTGGSSCEDRNAIENQRSFAKKPNRQVKPNEKIAAEAIDRILKSHEKDITEFLSWLEERVEETPDGGVFVDYKTFLPGLQDLKGKNGAKLSQEIRYLAIHFAHYIGIKMDETLYPNLRFDSLGKRFDELLCQITVALCVRAVLSERELLSRLTSCATVSTEDESRPASIPAAEAGMLVRLFQEQQQQTIRQFQLMVDNIGAATKRPREPSPVRSDRSRPGDRHRRFNVQCIRTIQGLLDCDDPVAVRLGLEDLQRLLQQRNFDLDQNDAYPNYIIFKEEQAELDEQKGEGIDDTHLVAFKKQRVAAGLSTVCQSRVDQRKPLLHRGAGSSRGPSAARGPPLAQPPVFGLPPTSPRAPLPPPSSSPRWGSIGLSPPVAAFGTAAPSYLSRLQATQPYPGHLQQQPTSCFHCKQFGHYKRLCPYLNFPADQPSSAPATFQ
uniref:CCHC-type domain-containing protein n=1 Tax=Plectus sambesii TaxID=2011161 RepID=A0A914X2E5_9BILA